MGEREASNYYDCLGHHLMEERIKQIEYQDMMCQSHFRHKNRYLLHGSHHWRKLLHPWKSAAPATQHPEASALEGEPPAPQPSVHQKATKQNGSTKSRSKFTRSLFSPKIPSLQPAIATDDTVHADNQSLPLCLTSHPKVTLPLLPLLSLTSSATPTTSLQSSPVRTHSQTAAPASSLYLTNPSGQSAVVIESASASLSTPSPSLQPSAPAPITPTTDSSAPVGPSELLLCKLDISEPLATALPSKPKKAKMGKVKRKRVFKHFSICLINC